MKPNQSETTNGRWEGKSQIRGRRAASRERERDAVVSVRPKPNRRAESHATQNPPTRNAKPAEKGAKEGAETPKGAAAWNPRNFLFTTPPPAPAALAAAARLACSAARARRRLGDGAKGRRQIKMQKSREKAAITKRKKKKGGGND
jgi:hypothetical protein